jgi:hypothetical protein
MRLRLPLPLPLSRPGSGPYRSRLAAALTAALLAAGLLAGTAPSSAAQPPAPAAHAPAQPAAPNLAADGDLPFATYNMQGSDNGLRWSGEVGPLTAHHPVVALQEVGSGPPAEPRQARGTGESIPIPGPFPAGLPRSVNHTQWQHNRQPRHVYFLQTDPQRNSSTGEDRWEGGRVNLAVVTHERADEVRIIENPLYNPDEPNNDYRYRRALGVRLGNTVYYNVHARGADVPDLLRGIRAAARPGENWVMLGDFNLNIRNRTDQQAREQSLHLRDDELLARPGRSTHQQGGELDYAITRGTPGFNAAIPAGRGSDHYPVQFEMAPTPVPAAPDGPAHTFSSAFENAATGAVLDIPDDGSGRVITHPQRYNAQQRFHINTVQGHWYRFAHGGSSAVAGAAQNVRAAAAEQCPGLTPLFPLFVTMRPCDEVEAQWHPQDPAAPGGPLRWHNSRYSQLCLTGTQRQGPVMAVPCSDSPAQLWWDNSRAVPEDTWESGDTKVRLRAMNDFVLDAQGGDTGNLTQLITHSRKDVDNQRWDIEYADLGDNLVRIKGVDSGKCVDVYESDTAGPGSRAVLYDCINPGSRNDGTGHRWQAETYADGTLRFRNEATHLCLIPPLEEKGDVTVNACNDDDRQRWTIEP